MLKIKLAFVSIPIPITIIIAIWAMPNRIAIVIKTPVQFAVNRAFTTGSRCPCRRCANSGLTIRRATAATAATAATRRIGALVGAATLTVGRRLEFNKDERRCTVPLCLGRATGAVERGHGERTAVKAAIALCAEIDAR
jgi:hypothetical protein